jgi:hypothetical protein
MKPERTTNIFPRSILLLGMGISKNGRERERAKELVTWPANLPIIVISLLQDIELKLRSFSLPLI